MESAKLFHVPHIRDFFSHGTTTMTIKSIVELEKYKEYENARSRVDGFG